MSPISRSLDGHWWRTGLRACGRTRRKHFYANGLVCRDIRLLEWRQRCGRRFQVVDVLATSPSGVIKIYGIQWCAWPPIRRPISSPWARLDQAADGRRKRRMILLLLPAPQFREHRSQNGTAAARKRSVW